jgi:hypothetical protein
MVLAQRECGWFQQRQRQSCIGTVDSGKKGAQATVRMSHQVGSIAHEVDNVVGIEKKILSSRRRASPITAPVRHQQTEAFVGERSLSLPLVGSCRQGAVH